MTGTRQSDLEPRHIAIGDIVLQGDLGIPPGARGIVLFAHGSGSSRHSPRNRSVAGYFRGQGLATLLMDLLTVDEERVDVITRELRFDIRLLATRLIGAVDWLQREPATAALDIGCYGSSTGAAAALIAASERPDAVSAVVSRGGRVDLAGPALGGVRAPTLMLVGELDVTVLGLNRDALAALGCEKALSVVPGATHLFEEPGAMEQVSRLAGNWFCSHLGKTGEPRNDD